MHKHEALFVSNIHCKKCNNFHRNWHFLFKEKSVICGEHKRTMRGQIMTTDANQNEKYSTIAILESRYGPLMSLKNIAEVLKYPTVDSVRKALARKTLPLTATRLPNRREIFIKTNEVAGYLDNAI